MKNKKPRAKRGSLINSQFKPFTEMQPQNYKLIPEVVEVYSTYLHCYMDDGSEDLVHRYLIKARLCGFMGGKDYKVPDGFGRWLDFDDWCHENRGDMLDWWCGEYINYLEKRTERRPLLPLSTAPFLPTAPFSVSISQPLQKAS